MTRKGSEQVPTGKKRAWRELDAFRERACGSGAGARRGRDPGELARLAPVLARVGPTWATIPTGAARAWNRVVRRRLRPGRGSASDAEATFWPPRRCALAALDGLTQARRYLRLRGTRRQPVRSDSESRNRRGRGSPTWAGRAKQGRSGGGRGQYRGCPPARGQPRADPRRAGPSGGEFLLPMPILTRKRGTGATAAGKNRTERYGTADRLTRPACHGLVIERHGRVYPGMGGAVAGLGQAGCGSPW